MIGIKVKPLLVAAKGKGVRNMLRRMSIIRCRYGLTTATMDRALTHFAQILAEFECSATFPIVAAAYGRNRGVIEKFQRQGIEFAVHGYYHIDHSQATLEQQSADFVKARNLFARYGLPADGFRCPYLRGTSETFDAVHQAGFLYDSSSSLAWDVLNGQETETYRHVLGFYGAKPAKTYPSLPRIEPGGLVEIPYNLPDDEALIDRLQFESEQAMCRPWQAMLDESHRLGELFTLGLHPERIFLCAEPLRQALKKARSLSGVWIARLDEIARWWLARTEVRVDVQTLGNGEYSFTLPPLKGLTVLGRGVEFSTPHQAWDGLYQQALGPEIRFRAEESPFIRISRDSDPTLEMFLRQQGYILDAAESDRPHSFFLHYQHFEREDERKVLAQIEQSALPLIRFGRWPDGARSALCVTGDIDALTIWDYILRFLGR